MYGVCGVCACVWGILVTGNPEERCTASFCQGRGSNSTSGLQKALQ